MGGNAKRQHYVPRFYLKRFTINGKRIFVFDKPSQKAYAANISTVASRKYFHDLSAEAISDALERVAEHADSLDPGELEEITGALSNPHLIEEHLSDLESRFAEVLEDVVGTLNTRSIFDPAFDPAHMTHLAFLMAVQSVRTIEYREYLNQTSNQGIVKVLKMAMKVAKMQGAKELEYISMEEIDKTRIEFTDESIKLQQLHSLMDFRLVETIAEMLLEHIWMVGKNQSLYPIHTSDNPVVRRPHVEHPWLTNSGFGSPGIEIAFPLSPKYILILHERGHFKEKGLETLDKMVVPLSKDNVTYYNSLQVNQSYQQVYSNKEDFGLAKMMCEKHPELTDPNRPRIEVH